ncbi:hypothetical protein [Salinimicrobium xinjiangense]|nr:hypothetical protein [Salinimicrobium xinjiangense]
MVNSPAPQKASEDRQPKAKNQKLQPEIFADTTTLFPVPPDPSG